MYRLRAVRERLPPRRRKPLREAYAGELLPNLTPNNKEKKAKMLSDNPTLEEVASYFANDQFATRARQAAPSSKRVADTRSAR